MCATGKILKGKFICDSFHWLERKDTFHLINRHNDDDEVISNDTHRNACVIQMVQMAHFMCTLHFSMIIDYNTISWYMLSGCNGFKCHNNTSAIEYLVWSEVEIFGGQKTKETNSTKSQCKQFNIISIKIQH